MFDVALLWFKDYGPIISALAIAGSSIYTALVLRRQNRATGWLQVEYHVVSQGWRLGPQPPDTLYPDPNPEPFDAGIPASHRVFEVPFDIEPQHLQCWEHVVGHRTVVRGGETIRNDQRLHKITCVKVETFKGETIHARLLDADRPSRLRLLWCEFRCKVGVHR